MLEAQIMSMGGTTLVKKLFKFELKTYKSGKDIFKNLSLL
jgi:hypothetical protein